MSRYKKGANAERELIRMLWESGFAVARVAGSGKSTFPAPDIVAINKTKKLAFESKAWRSDYLHLDKGQMDELQQWSEIAGAEFYIAWKVPNKGWYFLSKEMFREGAKGYSLSKKTALKKAINFNIILGKQSKLKV